MTDTMDNSLPTGEIERVLSMAIPLLSSVRENPEALTRLVELAAVFSPGEAVRASTNLKGGALGDKLPEVIVDGRGPGNDVVKIGRLTTAIEDILAAIRLLVGPIRDLYEMIKIAYKFITCFSAVLEQWRLEEFWTAQAKNKEAQADALEVTSPDAAAGLRAQAADYRRRAKEAQDKWRKKLGLAASPLPG